MIQELFNLTGKVALITGGTHGIGMAIGKVLGQAGAKICVNDISDEKLEECKLQYSKEGIDVYTLNFNVTSEEDVDRGITKIEKEVGEIDILVNNAGIIKRIPILDMAVADRQPALAVSYLEVDIALGVTAVHLQDDSFARHHHSGKAAGDGSEMPRVGVRFPIDDLFDGQRQCGRTLENDVRQAHLPGELAGGVNGKMDAGTAVVDVRQQGVGGHGRFP